MLDREIYYKSYSFCGEIDYMLLERRQVVRAFDNQIDTEYPDT